MGSSKKSERPVRFSGSSLLHDSNICITSMRLLKQYLYFACGLLQCFIGKKEKKNKKKTFSY